ncbi:cytochrome P450 [Lophiotrema nucula]|uniref:Cytochrome P450 n=1 Tax=Lophiotrema nucula TaxID=690887 RepID=A0A6A5ZVV3_9PLEO|nr:cytochrome P450 [Lophiotrema nucula]
MIKFAQPYDGEDSITFENAILITTSALIVYVILRLVRHTFLRRRFEAFARVHGCAPPPAITSSFLTGIQHKWKRLNQRGDMFNDYMNRVFQENGPTHEIKNTWTGETKAVYTIAPENVKTMLSTKFSDYHRPRTMPNALNPVMGQGVFTSNGEAWAHSRGLVRAQFSGKRVRDVSKLGKHMQNAFDTIESNKIGKDSWTEETEILLVFNRFTLDSATEFMFGTSAESHEAFLRESSEMKNTYKGMKSFSRYKAILDDFATAFDIALDYVALRLKLGRLWFLADGLAFRLACYKVRSYADDYIRRAVAHAEVAKINGKETEDDRRFGLISELVESYPDKVALRNQVLQLLVAGRDTTAATLTWAFILLEAHPEVFARLSHAVLEVFGTETVPLAPVTYENLRACTYLQHVVFEVVRLYPTGPLNARKASVNSILPTGGGRDGLKPIAVQKGTTVAYNTYLMHRREELWGPDAWKFRPARWEGKKASWEYIPFHGGPQTCLGRESIHFVCLVIITPYTIHKPH